MTKSKQQKKLNIVQDDETKDEDMKREKKKEENDEPSRGGKREAIAIIRHVFMEKTPKNCWMSDTKQTLGLFLVLFLTRAIPFTYC